jgi:heavy metal efflux system protein
VPVAYQTPAGTTAYVPLRELADISLDSGASYHLSRGERSATFPSSSACAVAISAARSRKPKRIIAKDIQLPNGYRIVWAGEFQDLQNAKQRLLVVRAHQSRA